MQQPPDHYDADLLLRLYDLRREEKLRKARDWFTQEFHADSFEDFLKRYPYGTEGNTFYRMVVGYWDMAASLLNHGLIHEDLFFENNAELLGVWIRIENLVPRMRETWKSPFFCKNLEQAAEKYERWVKKSGPEALPALRERIKSLAARKSE
jgi:hypothetical protein